MTPEECRSLAIFASPTDFEDTGYTAVRAQRLESESIYASQAVLQYDSPQTADHVVDTLTPLWQGCNGQAADTANDGSGAWEYTVKDVVVGERSVTAVAGEPSNQHICQNRLQAASVFVVRIAVCSPNDNGQAQTIAESITLRPAASRSPAQIRQQP